MPKKLTPAQRHAKAMEYSFWAGRLLLPEYFNDAANAIKAKPANKDAFLKICANAGIPKQVSEDLFAGMATSSVPGAWGGSW